MLYNVYKSTVFKFYLTWLTFVIALFLFSPTSIDGQTRFFGFLFFVVFFLPVVILKGRSIQVSDCCVKSLSTGLVIGFIVVQWIALGYAVKFYTGNSLYGVMVGFIDGVNLYQSYQDHFKESGIGNVSFLFRIPAVISLAYVKFIFIFVVSMFFQNRLGRLSKSLLFLSTVSYLVIGLARGTFFEVFEIFVAFAFFSYSSGFWSKMTKGKRILSGVFAFFLVLMLPVIFMLNTIRRYENPELYFSHSCNFNYCFDPFGISFYLEYLIYILTTYFSMGLFFLANFFRLVLQGDWIASLIPMYQHLLENKPNGVKDLICEEFACQYVWVPDIVYIISYFGFTSGLVFFSLVFFIIRFERHALRKFNIFSLPTVYFLLIYLLSLPVGMFYTVSSSSILSSFVFFGLWAISKKTHLAR